MGPYAKGQLIRVMGEFVGSDARSVHLSQTLSWDPVTFRLKNAAGATTAYVFGTNAQLLRHGMASSTSTSTPARSAL